MDIQPSAPHEDSHLYPTLPDFRFQKVNEISAALNKEVGHYRAVSKKYKRAKKVLSVCRLQYCLAVSVDVSLWLLQG